MAQHVLIFELILIQRTSYDRSDDRPRSCLWCHTVCQRPVHTYLVLMQEGCGHCEENVSHLLMLQII